MQEKKKYKYFDQGDNFIKEEISEDDSNKKDSESNRFLEVVMTWPSKGDFTEENTRKNNNPLNFDTLKSSDRNF